MKVFKADVDKAREELLTNKECFLSRDALDDFRDWYVELMRDMWGISGCEFLAAWNYANPFKKFLIYKLYACDNYDCDISARSLVFYQNYFEKMKNYTINYIPNENARILVPSEEKIPCYRGDTMTSAWTTIKSYIRFCWKMDGKSSLLVGKGDVPDWQRRYPSNQNETIWFDYILRNFSEFERILNGDNEDSYNCYKNMLDFLSVNHTVGNFIPVPEGFNFARSNGGKNDYWDYTLEQIKEWYERDTEDKRNDILDKFLSGKNKETAIKNCSKWIVSYDDGEKGWENFVNANYLNDSFVNDKYEIIVFSKEIQKSGKKNISDFNNFFEKATKCITDRGVELAKCEIALSIKQQPPTPKNEDENNFNQKVI